MNYYIMALIFFLIIFVLFIADYIYHLAPLREVKKIDFRQDVELINRQLKKIGLRARKYDDVFGSFPFLWSWIFIAVSISTAVKFNNFFLDILVIVFVSSRMRALQEIGHYALHGSLTKNKKYGVFLTNIFCQFPLMLPECRTRQISHCVLHHRYTNVEGKDPNLNDFIDLEFKPGTSKSHFWYCFFYPILPKGVINKLHSIVKNVKHSFFLRCIVNFFILAPFAYYGSYGALLKFYFIPLLFVYPLFAWISQMVEHRWFGENKIGVSRFQKELAISRPTEYLGVMGFFIKNTLLPFSDSHHLCHSLFPYVRYNYLPTLHRMLMQNETYKKNASYGLIFSFKQGHKSAVSDLYERLTVTHSKVLDDSLDSVLGGGK